jgi:hypothetical protein
VTYVDPRSGVPAGEVVAAPPEPPAPADDCAEVDERAEGERPRERERLARAVRPGQRGQRVAAAPEDDPRREQPQAREPDRVRDRPVAGAVPARQERRDCDERLTEDRADQCRPTLRPVHVAATEPRADRERRRRERADQEPGRKQQVGAPPLDRETHRREQRHEQTGERHRRLEDDQERRQVVLRPQHRVGDEERQPGAEQAGKQDLSGQPRLEVGVPLLHKGSCRQKHSCR